MARFHCVKGCRFGTNSPMQIIKHNIVEHGAKYSRETILKQWCNNHKLKQEVLKLVDENVRSKKITFH